MNPFNGTLPRGFPLFKSTLQLLLKSVNAREAKIRLETKTAIFRWRRCELTTAQVKELVPGLSTKQIPRAIDTPATPKKSSGRPLTLNAEQCEYLVWFMLI